MSANLISLETIKKGKLDEALERLGYIRSRVIAEKWGMTVTQLNKKFSAGYSCDCFMINGVRYISADAERPD